MITTTKIQKSPLYIFVGIETTLRDIAIGKIVDLFGVSKTTSEERVATILKIQNNTLLSNKHVYVVKEDEEVLKNSKLMKKLVGFTGNSTIIICFNTLDKRTSFYKTFSDKITWFNQLDEKQLIPLISPHIKLSERAYKDLIYVCNNDCGIILNTINKILCYANACGIDNEKSFYELIQQGIINIPTDDDTIRFVNYVANHDIPNVLDMLHNMKKAENIKTLWFLYNNFRSMFLIRCFRGNSSRIAEETGLNWGAIKGVQQLNNYYGADELERAMGVIFTAIQGIKSGKIENDIALAYVIYKIL